jgi:UPF0271 protein
LLLYATSVNIPCCVHDGHPRDVLQHIETARQYHCAIGAHIAYPDPSHQGYDAMDLSPEDLTAWLLVQIGTFKALCQSVGVTLEHVRPHGALYGKFIHDAATARLVAETLYKMDPWMILVGPCGPILDALPGQVGIRVAPEVQLGKRYSAQGVPIPQRFNDHLSPMGVLEQARQLISESALTTQEGRTVKLSFKTMHISPQLENAVGLAEKVSAILGQPVSLATAAVAATGWV